MHCEESKREGYKIYAMNLSSPETPLDRVEVIEVFDGKGNSTTYKAEKVSEWHSQSKT